MNSAVNIGHQLTHDVVNPFELSVEQALSGEHLIGNMLFVDKGALSSLSGSFSFSHQYLCIGANDNNEPLLLSISEEHKEVKAVSLSEALKNAEQVNVVPLHSGHKDPSMQSLIKEKAIALYKEYDGTTAAHYRMSEQKYIKGAAAAVGFAGWSYIATQYNVPGFEEFKDYFSNLDTIKCALEGVGALYLLDLGKNMMKHAFAGLTSNASSAVADNKDLAKASKAGYNKVIPASLEGKLKKVEEKDFWGISSFCKTLREHLYTDKFHTEKSRITMGDVVTEVLKASNPIIARDFEAYKDINNLRDVSPASMFQFMKDNPHFAEPKTFIKRDSIWGNVTRSVGDMATVVNNAVNAKNKVSHSPFVKGLNSLVNAKKQKHAKLDIDSPNLLINRKISVVVNELDGEPVIRLLDTVSGELRRQLSDAEIEAHFDRADFSSESTVEWKLKQAGFVDKNQAVIIDLDNWHDDLPAPTM